MLSESFTLQDILNHSLMHDLVKRSFKILENEQCVLLRDAGDVRSRSLLTDLRPAHMNHTIEEMHLNHCSI